MGKIIDILCPESKSVSIFEEVHVLRRLTMRDFAELLCILRKLPIQFSLDNADSFVFSTDAVTLLLQRSFPTFKRWEELEMSQEEALLRVVLAESNVISGLRSFTGAVTGLTGTLLQAGQQMQEEGSAKTE